MITLSIFPRYFFVARMAPFSTTILGCSRSALPAKAATALHRPPRHRYTNVSTTKLARTFGMSFLTAAVISAAVCPCSAMMAASNTRSPIPVERFSESMIVTCAAASSSSAARRMTLPEVDMLPEIEKQITSRPASTYGCSSTLASSRDGAEVFGVALFASAHAKMRSGVVSLPSRNSFSPSRICSGRISISYFAVSSCERSQVLSEMILTFWLIPMA